jgi:O-antigen ligase
MTISRMVDLAAIGALALALPVALVVAWRRRDLAAGVARSPLLAVGLAYLVCHPFAVDARYSAWRTLQWLAYIGVYVAGQAVPRRWVAHVAHVAGVGVAVAILGEWLVVGGRAGSWLAFNPNIAAATALPLAFLVAPQVGVVLGLAILATGSRGAILAGVVTMLATVSWRFVTTAGRLAGVGVVVALIVALAFSRTSTVQNRLDNWAEAGGLFLARPVVGWGPGCYPVLAQNEPDHPHADSFLFTVAAEQGLIGLAAWGWLILWAGRRAWRSDDPARWTLLAWAVHNLVDSTLIWYWPGIFTMISLALVMKGKGKNEYS